MEEIIEILFEEVNCDLLLSFLYEHKEKLDFSSMAHTAPSTHIRSLSSLSNSIKSRTEGSFYFKNFNFELSPNSISNFDVQILKYEDKIDLCLYTSFGWIKTGGKIKSIQSTTNKLAKRLKARMLICGFEPAIDEKTRFFTNAELGPLNA